MQLFVCHGDLQHKSSKYAIIVNSYTCLIYRPAHYPYTITVLILRSKCMWSELATKTVIKTFVFKLYRLVYCSVVLCM